jgi:hypothetical protein
VKLLALLAGIASPLAAAPIVISNADFEDGLTGWVVPSKYAARIASTSDTPHAGEKAVQIDVAADAEEPYLFAEISPIQGSATYRWSAFARRAVGGDGGKAGVKIEFYNARGENTSGVWFRKPLESAGSWMPLAVTAQADPDSVRAMLLLGASGVGAVAFDTAALEQTSLAPTLRILDPLRLAVRSNTAPPAKFTVAFQEKPAPAPPFAMEVLGGPRRLKQDARSQTLDAKTFSLTTRIPSLAAGIYTADVLSGALRSGTPAQLFATPLLRKPARLDTAGAALRRGKSFFPIITAANTRISRPTASTQSRALSPRTSLNSARCSTSPRPMASPWPFRCTPATSSRRISTARWLASAPSIRTRRCSRGKFSTNPTPIKTPECATRFCRRISRSKKSVRSSHSNSRSRTTRRWASGRALATWWRSTAIPCRATRSPAFSIPALRQ